MQYAICKQFETFHTLFGKLEVYTVDLMECLHFDGQWAVCTRYC